MHAVRFAGFRPNVRVIGLEGKRSFTREGLLRIILRNEKRVLARAKRKLARQWDSFGQDQGADPFDAEARVEIYLRGGLTGRWRMLVYWEPGGAWAGMHLRFEYFWIWPWSCLEVF